MQISIKYIKINAVNAGSVNVGRNLENKKVPRNTFLKSKSEETYNL